MNKWQVLREQGYFLVDQWTFKEHASSCHTSTVLSHVSNLGQCHLVQHDCKWEGIEILTKRCDVLYHLSVVL